MEIEVVATVKSHAVYAMGDRTASSRMKQNFTFMPKWHITSIVENTDSELDVVKQILDSSWGEWSPRSGDSDLVQSYNYCPTNRKGYRITLGRNDKGNRYVYLYSYDKPFYGNERLNACVAIRLYDMDDNGEFYNDDFDVRDLTDVQTMVNGDWSHDVNLAVSHAY